MRGIYHQVEVEKGWERGEVVEIKDGERKREREREREREKERMLYINIQRT